MFIDASAMVAVLTNEADAELLQRRIAQATLAITSPLAVFEAVLAIARHKALNPTEARAALLRWMTAAEIEMVPIGDAERDGAIEAFERFGKGRHPARLNMGDCFAYACARAHGVPLLFKGDDFTRTDIAAA